VSLTTELADNVEKRGASVKGNISKVMRCSYDVNFKIMVIKHAERTNEQTNQQL
jgi:hypothetical protein